MLNNILIKSLMIVMTFSLFACSASKYSENQPMKTDTQIAQNQTMEYYDMKVQLGKEKARVRELEKTLALQKNDMGLGYTPAEKGDMNYELFPPKARAGECYARVFVPSTYKTITETKLKKAGGNRIKIVPARYETVTEKVLKKAASERMEVVPAQYEWVNEQILVKPEHKNLIKVPAVYETATERVLVREAHKVWKKGTGPIQKIDEATGEIMCLVEEPALYKTISKKVLKTPATTREVITPAVFRTVKKKVMTKPPTTNVIPIPAEYRYVNVTKLVEPEREVSIAIPPVHQTVTKKVKVSDEKMQWKEVLCDTNMTRNRIVNIQQELKSQGYDPGPIDGVIGMETMGAVNKFQRNKGLLVSKYMTIETVKALGISPK